VYGINSVDPRRHQKGHFTEQHLHAVSRWLADLPTSTWRIVVTHQHFVVIPGFFRPGSIRQAEKVLSELSASGVHAILSGHMHFKYVGSTRDFFPHLHRPIALIHAGTATSGRLRGHESLRGEIHMNNFVLLEFEPLEPKADLSMLAQVPGVERLESVDRVTRVTLTAGCDPGQAIARITAAVPTARIEVARLRLDDVFVRLVAVDAGADAAELRAGLSSPEAAEVV
jgi:hypothetical protein